MKNYGNRTAKKALPGLRDIVKYGKGEDGDNVPGEWGIDVSNVQVKDGKVMEDRYHRSPVNTRGQKISEWKTEEVSFEDALRSLDEDELTLKQYKDDIERAIHHIQQTRQQVLELKEKQEKK